MAIEFIHSLEVAGDLTVDGVISKSDGGSSTQWDAAYGWGNHADAGYSTSNTNYYLNGVSFDTGNGKITFTISGATNKTVDIDGRYVISSHQGGGDYFAGHHSEGRLLANAYLSNDLGNARKRGSEFTLTNTSLSDGEIDSMFDGLATMAGIPTSDFEAGPVVIEFDIPRTLSYGAYVGIGFGNSTWRCKDVKIEAYSNGAWVTCVHETNNAYEDVYTNIPGNSGVGTTKFRYTLDKPNNNVRICHLWAYNYNSHLWSQIMMPRSGGQVYGDLTLDGKITASGSNSTNWDTAYNWGDHADGGYLASNAKAADSEKLDGIDSTGFVKQVSDGSTPDYQTPSSRRINPTTKNPTNAHYAISTFGNGGNVTGQLATHFQTGDLHSRGYNSVWSDWRRYHHSLDFSVTDVANGVTAHGWGDHKDLYLGITSKAADSDKLDGIDSSRVIYGDNATGTDSITGAQLNPEGHLKSGFYRVAKADSTIPNATSVNFVLHTSYSTVGNTAGFDLASNDKQDSDLYFRSATGGGRGDWQTIYTSRNFTDSSSNWNEAYGWGNHADEDYLTALPSHNHDGRYLKLNPRLKANADTITQSGIHIWDVSEATDDPTGASDGLLTTKYWDSSDWAVQMYEDFHQREIHIRNKRSGKWQEDWAQVYTTDNFSTDEIDKGVAAYGWGDHADAGYVTTDNDTIFNGGNVDNPVVIDNTSANCVLHWSDSGASEGAIKIKLPGFHSKSNWSMLVLRVTLYEYTSDAHTIYTVSGHDWTSGWYNKRIKKHGESAKNLHYAYSSSADEDYLILGEATDEWKYGHVTVDVIAHPGFYHSAMNLTSGWEISQVTNLEGVTIQKSTNEKVIDTANPSVANWDTAYGWGNHADGGYLTSLPTHGHETIQAESTYSIDVKDHGGHTWFRNASNQWTFQAGSSGDDWTQTFTHYLPNRTTANALMMEIGQRSSNAVDGSYKGVRIVKYASSKVVDGHLQVGTISITDGSSDNWNTAYGWGNHANAGYKTTDNDTIFNGGTVTNAIIAPRLGLTNNAEDTTENRITVYDSGTTSYGMMLWNANGTSSDWATMIYGPNQSNRRISFGKANADFAKGHSGVDELAWLDLDNGNYFTDGNIYPGGSTTKYVSTGRIDNWNTAHGWGNHADAGYITSIPINSKYVRSDVDDEATGKINFAYQVADFNDINGGLGVTPFKGAFQAKNRPGSGNYATGLEFTYHDSKARTQFAAASSGNNNTGELYVRSEKWGEDKVWSDWWKILHTGNSNTSNWDTAHGWGNHADGGYLTSYSETSDLESVRARDNKIAGVINFTPDTGDILQVDGQVILKRTTANGGITIGHDDSVIIAGGDTSSTLNTNINNAEETVFIGAEGGLKVFAFPDNMSGGWGARKEWRFQNDGDTDFPGKLYPSGGSTHYVDSTRIANWQTAYGWGDHSTRGYLTRSKPESPKILSRIVGDTIEVVITASGTGNIDQYLVFSSVVGSDFGLISVIPPDDFAEEMSVIDNSFDEGGKIEYRVYAVKQGVYSDVATTSQDFSVGELEPTNLSVVDLNNAKYIQWDAPSSKKRFVSVYNVYHHEHDTQGSLLRSSASLIYSGTNTSYMKPTSNNKFHQFWVEITES